MLLSRSLDRNQFAEDVSLKRTYMAFSMLTKVGRKKKKGKLSQPTILKNFLNFLVSFFPELKHHKITPPQRTQFQLSQEVLRYINIFYFTFFYKKVTNIFLVFQKASGLEYILVKCQRRNLLIVQKALFLSNLGIYVETVL